MVFFHRKSISVIHVDISFEIRCRKRAIQGSMPQNQPIQGPKFAVFNASRRHSRDGACYLGNAKILSFAGGQNIMATTTLDIVMNSMSEHVVWIDILLVICLFVLLRSSPLCRWAMFHSEDVSFLQSCCYSGVYFKL